MIFGRKHFLPLLLIVSFIRLSAQKSDSTILFSSTQNEEMFGIRQSSQKTDTILDNIQNYYQNGVLGNIGLPTYSLLAKDNSYSSNFFNWTKLNNSNDLFTDKQPLYFRPSGKVYTKITAVMGQKQEQVFKIQHSQNIKRVNISLLFNRYSCFGFYLNQKTITDNLLASSNYITKNGRWGYNSYLLFNKLKYQLNGGIQGGDTALEQSLFLDKQLLPVNLTTSKQNVRTSSFFFSTFFRLNKSDSSNINHFLIYEGNYQSNYWIYSGADTGYYKHYYFYSSTGAALTDSMSVKGLSNSFLYRMNVAGNKFVFYTGYKSEFNHYLQSNIDTLSLNHIARAGFCLNVKNNFFNTNIQYVASGYNQSNYAADAHYLLTLGKNFYFDAKANANKQMAALSLQRYFSPHFIWNNNFANIITQNATIAFGSTKYKFSIGAFVQQQQNAIYFDTLALPKQYNGNAVNGRFFIQKDLKLWHVHFNNIINYQPENNTDFIRLPNIQTFSQLYYEGKLFKNNLWLQVGVQARYVSAYKANAYMPATNQFYLQDSKTYGDYFFADVFLNAQIDRFRFFLMAQHVNQGLTGGNYILCPDYPMPDRSFKAGLVWMFFD
jgi:hypothetical protein